MSESRKTLFRYSDERKVTSSARIHKPNESEQSEEIIESARVSYYTEYAPVSKCSSRYSERTTYSSREGVNAVGGETKEKATKRLNIPFDEVVYQDLISLNETAMKIKSDEFGRLTDRSRRQKKLDPEPDLFNFFRPTKQEYLFCDFLGKNADLDGEGIENGQSLHNLMSIECDDKVSNDFVPDADGGSEDGKPIACEEMDLETLDVDTCSIERFRLLHENYGLEPPKLTFHYEGSSLHKRSHAWKIDQN